MLFSLLSRSCDPVFPLKMSFPLFGHSLSVEQGGESHEKVRRSLLSGRGGPGDRLKKLWTDHKGNRAEL